MLGYLKLGGGLLGLVALGTLLFFAWDRFNQKTLADEARACNAAAPSETELLAPCLPEVRERIMAARRALACDIALFSPATNDNRFAIRMSCGEGVKRLFAERDALESAQASLTEQLAEARASTADAVARAERRAASTQERSSNADKAIQSAPRGPSGLVECDAQCLRDIAGQ